MPEQVQRFVRRRSAGIDDLAWGRVLDLGVAHDLRFPLSSEVVAAPAGWVDDPSLVGPVDLAVSVAALHRYADLRAAVDALRCLLSAGGHLVFVEPTRVPGLVDRIVAAAGVLSDLARRASPPDLLDALWAGGFTVTDVSHLSVPTVAWPYRHWVAGIARPARPRLVGGDAS